MLNTITLILAFNLLLGGVYLVNDWKHGPPARAMGEGINALPHGDQANAVDAPAYEGVPPEQVKEVLRDFTQWCNAGLTFDAWTSFNIVPFRSPMLNVETDTSGAVTRLNGTQNQPAGTPEVWVFGGSTLFGWDVADRWTIPFHMQEAMPEKVVNFGRPGFYSSQELGLLMELLKSGRRPQTVVFLDGFNDCVLEATRNDSPPFAGEVSKLVDAAQHPRIDVSPFFWIPMVRLALELKNRHVTAVAAQMPQIEPRGTLAARITQMYFNNVTIAHAICDAYGVRALFCWQPVAFFHYDRSRIHTLQPTLFDNPALTDICEAVKKNRQVHFLGDLASDYKGAVYIDMCHYTPGFNAALARAIAACLKDANVGAGR